MVTSGADSRATEEQRLHLRGETKLTQITTLQERKGISQWLGLIFIYMIVTSYNTYIYILLTQIIQVLNMCFTVFFLLFFLNLTCVLKKSQSWGLSSCLQDKKERAAVLDQSQPSVILYPQPHSHYIWTERTGPRVQTPGKLFKFTQTAEGRRYNWKALPLFITYFTLIFPYHLTSWPQTSYRRWRSVWSELYHRQQIMTSILYRKNK